MKRIVVLLLASLLYWGGVQAQNSTNASLPLEIYSGKWNAGHIQGIAVDTERKYIYFSFTTLLIKADMQGNIVGTVKGLLGHLGCLEFNDSDGRLYGSLEYKGDSIGRGILEREKSDRKFEDGFYVAIFDVNKIDRHDMDAEKDGVMTTVFLPTVLADYQAKVNNYGTTLSHRFGCSGFDGISFGPRFGSSDGKHYLTIAYGIYKDTERIDNDHQILLQYDTSKWKAYEQPLSQDNMHRRGPSKPDARYFVRTGNKNWGVQNLEYDPHSKLWLLATYEGYKREFANFTLFAIAADAKPAKKHPECVDYVDTERVLSLAPFGDTDPANPSIRGWYYDASVGLCSLGDGLFFIAEKLKGKGWQACRAHLLRFDPNSSTPFTR